METSARKVFPLTGANAITNRHILDLVPFNACNNKPLYTTKTSRPDKDGSYMVVKYTAPTPITDYEAKTSLGLFKMCLDASAHKGETAVRDIKDKGRFVEVQIDVRDMSKYISGRTTREQRMKVYNSLKKVKDMGVDMTKIYPDGKEQNVSSAWIYEIATIDDYETAVIWINKTALAVAAADGIAYDFKCAIQYRGRGFLLYLHMQSWKCVVGKLKSGKAKYGYQNHIDHSSLVQALDLEYMPETKQMYLIRESFKSIGFNYVYKKYLGKWRKGTK